MPYSVSLRKDGVILVVDPDIIDVQAAEQMPSAIAKCSQKLRSEQRKVWLLIDARPVRRLEQNVVQIMVERTLKMDFDRMAVFGANALQSKIINLMLMAGNYISQKAPTHKIKLFSDQQSAEAWLKT